ncbi:hypothetical protein Tco_0224523 [Tanacetum coccineum]
MSLDEASSRVTYTSISSDYKEPSNACSLGFIVYEYDGLPMHLVDPYEEAAYVLGPEEPEQAPPSLDYIPGPEYPEYLAPSDTDIPVEDQPYADDALPTDLSLSYIADSNPEDESEDGPTDYPTDGGDDDDDDSSGNDADIEDEEEVSEDDEEEHLAPADSTAVPLAIDLVLSAEVPEPVETDESAATPPPPAYHTTSRMSVRS